MSTWILVALSSVALFTTINFIDKYLLEDRLPDSYGVIMISSIISFCVGIIVWVSIGSPFLPLQYAIPLIASGLFVICSLALHFYVLSQTKVSFVNIFFLDGKINFHGRLSISTIAYFSLSIGAWSRHLYFQNGLIFSRT